jgi:hypothetical protein
LCCGSGSGFTPGIGVQKGKDDPQNKRKSEKCPYFEVLDDVFGGLEASHVTWTSFMKANGLIYCNFLLNKKDELFCFANFVIKKYKLFFNSKFFKILPIKNP